MTASHRSFARFAFHSTGSLVRRTLSAAVLLSACGGDPIADAPSEPRVHDLPQARAEPSRIDGGNVSAPPAAPPKCPVVRPAEVRGKLPAKGFDEVSGLVVSRSNPDILWVHNDSGDSAHVYALDASGKPRLEVDLRGADAVDYEEIALGPGPVEGQSYLYVGDIGDNFARRRTVQIYRLPEPDVRAVRETKIVVSVERIDVAYEGGPRDAEAMAIDPQAGDLYIVSKGAFFASNEASMPVFRVTRADLSKSEVVAKPVGQVALGPVTAADILPDGSGIAVRNYRELRFWPRAQGQSVADALRGESCLWPLADEKQQGEAFGFHADGRGYFTISEGAKQPVYSYALE